MTALTSEKEMLILLEEALAGERGEDQNRIASTALRWAGTILKKNADYGSSVWKEPFLAPGMPVSAAIFCRMSDKAERIRQLQAKDAEVAESLEDTVSDLGSYCLLWLARPKE